MAAVGNSSSVSVVVESRWAPGCQERAWENLSKVPSSDAVRKDRKYEGEEEQARRRWKGQSRETRCGRMGREKSHSRQRML